MATTRTGSFPIGFRRDARNWQGDLAAVIRFAQDNGFAGIDTGALPPAELRQILDVGLRIGSVDLPQPWTDLAAPDADKRKAAAGRCAEYVQQAVALGVRNFFVVVIPEEHAADRRDNLDRAADGYGRLCEAIADTDAHILLEGWPGPGPHYSSLACTPADYRLFFDRVGSDRLGVNFDPSHLVRLGIDPLRFIAEFAPRIHHVHAKDTELLDDERYEHGNLQPATLAAPHAYGGHHWRYTIPGHGVLRWTKLLTSLADAGYEGMLSIELEDEHFMNSDEATKRGLTAGRDFLTSV